MNITVDCIPYLVENEFDINEKDHFGRTPLYWACINKDIKLIDYLVNSNADLTIPSKVPFYFIHHK